MKRRMIFITLILLSMSTMLLFCKPAENASSNDNNDEGTSAVVRMNLKQGSEDIANGSGSYDFGEIEKLESSSYVEFTVENTGDANITINSITSEDTTNYTLTNNITSFIPKQSKANFKIRFNPSTEGELNSIITIIYNTNRTYTFGILGKAIVYYELNVESAHGKVIKEPDKGKYKSGELVKIHVEPDDGYYLHHWEGHGDFSQKRIITVEMNSDKNISAHYMQKEVIEFDDLNFKVAVIDRIGKLELIDPEKEETIKNFNVYNSDLLGIDLLTAIDKGIKNIKGIEKFPDLTMIDFQENEIVDISPLENLTKMTDIDLSKNKIVDVSPLKNLTNMNSLLLHRNSIEDVGVLKDLKKMVQLTISNNKLIINFDEPNENAEIVIENRKRGAVVTFKNYEGENLNEIIGECPVADGW